MLDDSKIKQNYKNIHKELLSLYEEQKKTEQTEDNIIVIMWRIPSYSKVL
ncbi:hypothetical protein CUPS4244_08550 [Campylobacter upsaliensis]|nr:hypothetical protein [Campylobacter upsaliensis]MCR2105122.1 hypothetical protein [Campylobacter upsaliensis]